MEERKEYVYGDWKGQEGEKKRGRRRSEEEVEEDKEGEWRGGWGKGKEGQG